MFQQFSEVKNVVGCSASYAAFGLFQILRPLCKYPC